MNELLGGCPGHEAHMLINSCEHVVADGCNTQVRVCKWIDVEPLHNNRCSG